MDSASTQAALRGSCLCFVWLIVGLVVGLGVGVGVGGWGYCVVWYV